VRPWSNRPLPDCAQNARRKPRTSAVDSSVLARALGTLACASEPDHDSLGQREGVPRVSLVPSTFAGSCCIIFLLDTRCQIRRVNSSS
jgi:hypothetical protein